MSVARSEPVPTRVLLVEDNEDAVDIYATSLRVAGFDVVVAETVEAAQAIARSEKVDVVVLDCRLPDGDGLALLEGWRRRGAMRDVPVIVLTASVARQDVEAAIVAGADRYVPKPCPGHVLAGYVAAARGGRRPSGHLPKVEDVR